MKNNHSTHKGMTLSEVLVVIGMLGVVAALTIPALIKNINDDRWNRAAEVFEWRLTEAVSQMNTRLALQGQANTLAVVNNLKNLNIMKITKICPTWNGCFYSGDIKDGTSTIKASDYNDAGKFGHSDWGGTTPVGFTLANGANVLLAYNKNCTMSPALTGPDAAKCAVAALYDTNGFDGPNEVGKDIKFFNKNDANCDQFPGAHLIAGKCWLTSRDSVHMNGNGEADTCPGGPYRALDQNCNDPSICHWNTWAVHKEACTLSGMRLATAAEYNELRLHRDDPEAADFVAEGYFEDDQAWTDQDSGCIALSPGGMMAKDAPGPATFCVSP